MSSRVVAVFGVLLGLALSACQGAPLPGAAQPALTPVAPSAAPIGAPTAAAVPVGAAASYDYRLGPGDKLRVIVFGEDSLGGEFLISGAGKVAMPLVGDVPAVGLTLPEFQAAVETRLRDGYIRDPRVSAEVLNYRPFYILGEVVKPGEYPYSNALTVVNAVATAQGFTYRADPRKVFIRHANEASEHAMPLTTTTRVEPGDTIRIPERFF